MIVPNITFATDRTRLTVLLMGGEGGITGGTVHRTASDLFKHIAVAALLSKHLLCSSMMMAQIRDLDFRQFSGKAKPT